jgi:hypothetical protein
MKKVILLAMLMPYLAFGQIVENFECGNLNNWVQSSEGRWKADSITPLSGSFSLHHIFDNPNAGNDRIALPLKYLHPSEGTVKWSFILRHGYDPSSSNNWAVFLMSDSGASGMSVSGGTNGYVIGVNINGSDDSLRLVRVKDGVLTTVVNCRLNWQTTIGKTNPVRIVVERTSTGNWMVSVLRIDDVLISSANGSESELFNIGWFGIIYRYSATADRLLWLDDIQIEGVFYEDNEPPLLKGIKVSGKNSIDITFNERPSAGSLVADNFALESGSNRSMSLIKLSDFIYRSIFVYDMKNKEINDLIINRLCDNSDNCAFDIHATFTPLWADRGDVIISEIMSDPLPEVSLPEKEYIELTNRTDYSFNLKNWKLKSGDQSYPLDEVMIESKGVMILCAASDIPLFTKYGEVTGLKQFPSLTDGGKTIFITDSSDVMIHGVEYTSDWYGDELKSGGGWSLEMIDTDFPFFYEGNWTPSISRTGGTPGKINSVMSSNPDNLFYGIQNVFPQDSASIIVKFSEPVFGFQGMVNNIQIGGKNIIDIYEVDPLYRSFCIKLQDPILRRATYYFEISGDITDFAGNSIQNKSFSFGLPEVVKPGDILFNELLFNPFPGDPDYIELFNCSENIVDASRLQIVSLNTGDTSALYPVSVERKCFMPQSYYALTTDKKKITERYFSSDPQNIFEAEDLPSMPDDEGHLVLFNRELDKIDEVTYSEKMHYALLKGFEGVALEKTSPLLKSGEPVNWHSATESSGWGTPGSPNSLYSELPALSDNVILSSSRITPDNDGYEDFLVISFNLKGNDNVISASVYDESGNFVKKLASNLLTGPNASLIWDGTADDATLVRSGIYIVFISLYDDTGKTDKWKKVCSVIRR